MAAHSSRNRREARRRGRDTAARHGGRAARWFALCGRPALLLATTLALGGCPPSDSSQDEDGWREAHASLEAAERAFASRSVDAGVRAAFLRYLAPDGVIFQPGPIVGRTFWEAQPEVEGTLWWAPRVVEVARSGDIGYTTGPYGFTAGERTGHGWYSSVWRRGADGAWQVAVDLGIRTAEPAPADTVQRPADHIPWDDVAAAVSGEEREPALAELLAADDAFAGGLQRTPDAAYREYGSTRLRVHRDTQFPLTDPDTILAWRRALRPAGAVERVGSGIANSGDLGYTYGTARGPDEAYGWLRVWRRMGDAGWRLVLDVAAPTPGAD